MPYNPFVVVKITKAKAGLYMRKKLILPCKVYRGVGGIRLVGYSILTVGITEEMTRRYIKFRIKKTAGKLCSDSKMLIILTGSYLLKLLYYQIHLSGHCLI